MYSLQIEQTTLLKTFPYDWTLPIKRSFLVMSDSPGPDDIALGNRHSSALMVPCYMEGCDKPANLLFYPLMFLVVVVVIPFYWIRLVKNWEIT